MDRQQCTLLPTINVTTEIRRKCKRNLSKIYIPFVTLNSNDMSCREAVQQLLKFFPFTAYWKRWKNSTKTSQSVLLTFANPPTLWYNLQNCWGNSSYVQKIHFHHSITWYTDSFEVRAGVLQGNTLAPFIVVLDYVLCISLINMQEKGLLLKPRFAKAVGTLQTYLSDPDRQWSCINFST